MGNQDYPVRRGSIGPGNPAQFDHQEIINKIKAANSTPLHDLSSTYAALERLLYQAEIDLAYHRGRLKSAWSKGPSSEAALTQIRRLEGAAHELAEVSGQFQNALRAAGRTIDVYKSTLPSEATGPLGVKDSSPPSAIDQFAKDREAQRHMTEMNNGLITAYAGIPTSITLDLFDRSGDIHPNAGNGGTSSTGTGGSGGGGGTGSPNPDGTSSRPGNNPGTSLPDGSSQPDPSGSGGSGGNGGSSGGTDLEGAKPGGATPTPSGVGPAPGGAGPGAGGASPGGFAPGFTGPGAGGYRPNLPSAHAPGVRPPSSSGPGTVRPTLNPSGVIGATPANSRPGTTRPAGAPGGVIRGATGAGTSGAGGVYGRQPGAATGSGRTGVSRASTPLGGHGPMSPGANRDQRDPKERRTALHDEEDLWADDDDTAPPVIR